MFAGKWNTVSLLCCTHLDFNTFKSVKVLAKDCRKFTSKCGKWVVGRETIAFIAQTGDLNSVGSSGEGISSIFTKIL